MDYKLLNKFGLGSAQFGLKYGINKQKIPRADIKKILKSFNTIHGKIIDTSPLYGFSEKMLGELSPKNNRNKLREIKIPNTVNESLKILLLFFLLVILSRPIAARIGIIIESNI